MTEHKIIIGDSRKMSSIEDKSVQLIVTSPPYPMVSMWDDLFIGQDRDIENYLNSNKDMQAFFRMHYILNETWLECDRVLADGGFVCINIGDATRTINNKFRLYSNHTQVINFFVDKGYTVLPDIHWHKPNNSPNKFMGSGMYPAGAYVTYEHEYILVFRKGDKRQFNTQDEKDNRKESAYFWEERNTWFSDLWNITGTSQTAFMKKGRNRNGSYPFEIPYRLINMYSVKGDTVLDPFMGLGTTNLTCMLANRNSIGMEVDTDVKDLALERLSSVEPEKLNQVVYNRLKNHKDFIDNLTEEKRDRCYINDYYDFLVKTKQETDIIFDEVASIERNDNVIRCNYK